MKPISAFAGASVLLALSLGTQLAAQPIIHITSAPFTANLSFTADGGRTYSNTQLARDSNGSTYQAVKFADGRTFRITIEDVPNNRTIVLTPQPPSYTYQLLPAREGGFRTYSIEGYREILLRGQDFFVQRPDHDKGTKHIHNVVLGVRQQDGMTLYGHREEVTTDTGEKRTTDIWFSDLGVPLGLRLESGVSTLIDLRRVEPDPKLFEIPAEYLHPDALLSAKTVFIENRTAFPEVVDGAQMAFNSWKRLAVADSKEAADLIAVFTTKIADDQRPPEYSIEMNVYQPNSEDPIFTSHLGWNPNAVTRGNSMHPGKSTAQNCVIDLINRVQNTHIGLVDPPHPIN